MSEEEIHGFLTEVRAGVLTTLGVDGFPHSTAMWFIPRADEISMWAYSKSQKVKNLRRDPRVAFLVEAGIAYGELHGVLLRARARLVDDIESVGRIGIELYRRYEEARTGVDVMEGPIIEIERQATKRTGIVIGMERVASWDHRRL